MVGLKILSSADPAEQRAVERNLLKLRAHVRKRFRDPKHVCTLVIRPPEPRKAAVMFYLFPERSRDKQRAAMQQLAAEIIEAENPTALLILSRSTERWGQPYETVLLVRCKEPPKGATGLVQNVTVEPLLVRKCKHQLLRKN